MSAATRHPTTPIWAHHAFRFRPCKAIRRTGRASRDRCANRTERGTLNSFSPSPSSCLATPPFSPFHAHIHSTPPAHIHKYAYTTSTCVHTYNKSCGHVRSHWYYLIHQRTGVVIVCMCMCVLLLLFVAFYVHDLPLAASCAFLHPKQKRGRERKRGGFKKTITPSPHSHSVLFIYILLLRFFLNCEVSI